MKDAMINALVIIAITSACIGSFILGRASVRHTSDEQPLVMRDTIVVRDTLRVYYPQEVVRTVVRTERVEMPVVVHDTIRDVGSVELSFEEREYMGEDYRAIVGGYQPYLKSFEVYPRTTYVNTTETIAKRKRWGISLGVQGGYGVTPAGMQPYAGIGVSFGYTF